MLDAETKRRLDTARDILVGKVPNPQSQVEQITIALIYKFMDDLDNSAVAMGGKRSFFINEYQKFAWSKLFAPAVGGEERLKLYGEAMSELNRNPHLPQLFRDIFKNAYLPYRDPETLNLFLKTVGEFNYGNSENLGDAFEYLLSILGSQGDAGQFRTPRHIIDFMVEVIAPQKSEKILDPACGTAGFLISAYKFIREQNRARSFRDQLTTTEMKTLLGNFTGYDISPDMVRLSRVNLYLHGFVQPHIFEYDALTSDDKWSEYADVILANPPFMSPKGGIKPHDRFSVKSKRSEVLFVDYIAEHLTPNGRAAVIVPEGIIFQSAGAYKQLRKMLVEKYLYAVVSLPAGVFNPYSGVKTSILFLDKTLAKKRDAVLFVKVENDGFGLGAQRKISDKDDLPAALAALKKWSVNNGRWTVGAANMLVVPKAKIAENGDYNLTGERYRVSEKRGGQKWAMVKLGEVCEQISDTIDPQTMTGEIKYVGLENIASNSGEIVGDIVTLYAEIQSLKNKFTASDILYGKLRPKLNKVYLAKFSGICSTDIYVLRANGKILPELLVAYLRSQNFNQQVLNGISGAQLPRVNFGYMVNIKIPLPPLEVQREIVAEIAGYQRLIDGARQVVENWKPRIEVRDEWETVRLGDVCEINPESAEPQNRFGKDDFVYIDISSIENGTGNVSLTNIISIENAPSRARRIVRNGDVLLSTVRPNLKAFAILDGLPAKCLASTRFAVLRCKSTILPEYLYASILSDDAVNQMTAKMGKGAYPSINSTDVGDIVILLPPLAIQWRIVDNLRNERKTIDGCLCLINVYAGKVKTIINRVWN